MKIGINSIICMVYSDVAYMGLERVNLVFSVKAIPTVQKHRNGERCLAEWACGEADYR